MESNLMLLAQVPLFAGVGPEGLEEIGRIARERAVPAGTVLTHEGRQEGYFFVVIEGTIRIERGGRTINTMGPGDFLGEIALLDGGPRTATATAETPCRLLSLMPEQISSNSSSTSPRRLPVSGVSIGSAFSWKASRTICSLDVHRR